MGMRTGIVQGRTQRTCVQILKSGKQDFQVHGSSKWARLRTALEDIDMDRVSGNEVCLREEVTCVDRLEAITCPICLAPMVSSSVASSELLHPEFLSGKQDVHSKLVEEKVFRLSAPDRMLLCLWLQLKQGQREAAGACKRQAGQSKEEEEEERSQGATDAGGPRQACQRIC